MSHEAFTLTVLLLQFCYLGRVRRKGHQKAQKYLAIHFPMESVILLKQVSVLRHNGRCKNQYHPGNRMNSACFLCSIHGLISLLKHFGAVGLDPWQQINCILLV